MKRFIAIVIALILSMVNVSSIKASENSILDEILAKEEERQEIYEDRVREIEGTGIEEDRRETLRRAVTCYIEPGRATSTGSYKMDKIIAGAQEYVGCVAQVYRVAEDGGIGEFIGYYPIEDTGYGAPSGHGESRLKPGKSLGTIELGLTYDFRKPSMQEAKAFMKETYTGEGLTGSEVYIIIEKGEG